MGNPLDQNSAKEYATLITLSWHTSTVRYTDRAEDVILGANTFIAVPAIEVELPTFSGEAEYEPAFLTLPITVPPAYLLKRPYPSPVVTVLIEEADPTNYLTQRKLFKGTVIKVRRNPEQLQNAIKMEIAGPKYSIGNTLLGLMAQTTCPWALGDTYCGIDLDNEKSVTAIHSIDGALLTLTGDAPATEKWFHRGKIIKDGVSIMIRDASYNDLILAKLPPPEWEAGDSVTAYPGCDKTITTCRAKWNNESRFCGCGYAMPGYSPMVQTEP